MEAPEVLADTGSPFVAKHARVVRKTSSSR
jgi:hypothetical protein